MIKAIIFDLDNTLLDFMSMKSSSINAAVNGMIEAGLELDSKKAKEEIFKIYENKGYEYQDVLTEFVKAHCGDVDYKILAGGIVEYKRAKEKSLKLYPDVTKTLITLSKMGLKIAILSDAPTREAWTRLYTVKLHHIFDEVVTFNDTGVHKPGKEPFMLMIDRLKIDSKDCLMVGDWPDRDIKGAKQFGMKTAFAKYGNSENIAYSDADYDLEHFSDLLDIIKKENN